LERDMNITRIIALGFLGLAAIGAVRVVAQQPTGIGEMHASVSDPLIRELDRCRQLNEKAQNDQGCQTAYAENRKRFFTPPGPYVPGKVDLFPHKQPLTADRGAAPAPGEK
jgi:conjugative transfer region protein TrbK